MVSRPRQLPLVLPHEEATSRDDLVVGASNRAAVALLESWPHWPGPVAVLIGPPGSGKSHLGAIWRETAGAAACRIDALGPATLDLAERGPVFIDDAEPSARQERDLFHLINAVRGAGRHLLMTARRPPAAWAVTLPDLASRLKAAALVEIGAPDETLLHAVMIKLFADRQLDIDPQVVEFLVLRMDRSLEAANEMVRRLDEAALSRRARITRPLAAAVLADIRSGAR